MLANQLAGGSAGQWHNLFGLWRGISWRRSQLNRNMAEGNRQSEEIFSVISQAKKYQPNERHCCGGQRLALAESCSMAAAAACMAAQRLPAAALKASICGGGSAWRLSVTRSQHLGETMAAAASARPLQTVAWRRQLA